MNYHHFFLSPLLYALIAVGLAAEVFLFFPNSYQAYTAQPTLDNLPLVAVDGIVMLVLVLLALVTVSVTGGILRLRVAGLAVRHIDLIAMETVSPSFPFVVFQKKGEEKGKGRYCPAVASPHQFLAALKEGNPALRVETGRRNPNQLK
jgi:hypothetical protein